MSDNKGILAVCESIDGKLKPISAEAIGIGSKLAGELNTSVYAVIVGDQGVAQEAVAAGADTVYRLQDVDFTGMESDTLTALLETVLENCKPAMVIMGQDDLGRDQAPRLAFRVNSGVTMDCVELLVKEGRLTARKPVYGGNAIAEYTSDSEPYIVTIRSKAMAANEPDASRQGEVSDLKITLEGIVSKIKTAENVVEESAGIKLEDARIIVSGGRGIGATEGFGMLEELAGVLGGAVGASRPPCDNNWIADTSQIGLTGKIVAPELYIAVAISGSSQHMSGCSGSKIIIAINKDKEANIFRHARFGIVGDWKKILPSFTDKVKELVSS